ncbi:hypothetical protein CQA53_04275 [Helicobacter didelphidarum]|uniref:Outer membrane protein beta-barrel domain-containing protein n=1 Tax=Helicobacter didelphidarum TaxID=2040648 RepID=A0A3D8INP2_9HELI|nr:hypothetical protein [Helicobacter didelphidarum]RDU66234.1 hypothetical protein CQA53_04275 [Helicobacter didelphidarum]
MKALKATILASILGVGVSNAAIISAEIGGSFSASMGNVKAFNLDDKAVFSGGAYARVWLKPSILRIGGFFKWESIGSLEQTSRWNNFQYGGLLGFEMARITPYIGIAYSHFTNIAFNPTWALNYGVKFSLPFHITLGIEGSYQEPRMSGVKVETHRIGATLGLEF